MSPACVGRVPRAHLERIASGPATALTAVILLFVVPSARAEVTRVAISSRTVVANGQSFGNTGPYEKLIGRIEFALDPAHPRNKAIVDLDLAPRGPDKRVHFSADLFVLQPVDRSKGNGVLLFEIANRGNKGLLQRFNRFDRAPGGGNAQAAREAARNPTAAEDFGDGFLLSEGYTLVWVGWQFDVAAPLLTIDAPRADLKGQASIAAITFILNDRATEASPADLPGYAPADRRDPTATLTVRNRYWESPQTISRERWSFVSIADRPRIRLEGGFEPGRVYELRYRSSDPRVAGAGLAAIRDAAAAFRYGQDMPVSGKAAYVFGVSQSGRFLRQFLADGFNLDERDRRVFDAVWPHIAGAGLGSFNERFAMPGYSSFSATRFPFSDSEQTGPDGRRAGILSPYTPEQRPKIFYTNTPVEYWGQGRAAALTHTTLDGASDLALPDNVRMYLLSSTQHGEAAFPPARGGGQELPNPMPQRAVMRALLRALHKWTAAATLPPDSRYPKLADGTLVKAGDVRFPVLPRVGDPRTIEEPGLLIKGTKVSLPFLVPQVDADGNDLAGIRVPEVAVPLATATGWTFRSDRIGNPTTILALTGSYIPLPRTRAEREASKDPRRSIEERYRGRDDYLQRIRASAVALIKGGYLLQEDLEDVVQRAARHWDWRAGSAP
jgi:hypothetical protein